MSYVPMQPFTADNVQLYDILPEDCEGGYDECEGAATNYLTMTYPTSNSQDEVHLGFYCEPCGKEARRRWLEALNIKEDKS